MTTLVTGATGFVGNHVARALLARGRRVRCLVRESSRRDLLRGLDVELAVGDLRDPPSLERAVDGVRHVYHVAADYRLWVPDRAAMIQANVDGTDRLCAAAHAAGVERFVYTSSVGALGLNADGTPANERTAVDVSDMIGPYKRSKFMAEQKALEWAERGLDLVIVNPSTPIGEGDIKPTPTGNVLVDFLRGGAPAYVDTGLNLVDVRDVARGHLLAAAHGRTGERYILGGENLSLRELFERLAPLTGHRAPRLRLPHWIPWLAAVGCAAWSRVTRRPPSVTLDGVRMSRHKMYFDSQKARDELGYDPQPIDPALERAIDWFREHDYGKR